ncbi:DNA polymerase III subunit delta [Litoreibacter roseus]|uniref:DNA-directed DNA polymerase n=1 Tax=Litoreibacter roseus TaxID=2601869 RepID=A0A6N6JLV9_9RHOB|nr:DNA polymerase III subunit delta [Litoreibacter roseus]GFE66258.1 DNA polymerase III subunit delta [Litoreibacter roseus]
MKLPPRDARSFFEKPDLTRTGVLIYGPDPMRTALKRQQLISALIGPTGEDEMRLTRIAASEMRKEPALLSDAIKAVGFFPGQRVAFLEEANDVLAASVTAAIDDWQQGDAFVVITAGQLKPTSKLRKLFEAHPNAYAAAVYADPPGRDEIEKDLRDAGLGQVAPDAMSDLMDLGRILEPGDFKQTVEKLSLYKLGDETPVSPEDIALCAPATAEAALDDALDIVAEGRVQEIGTILSKLEAQGVAAVRLCIGASQHFRKLYLAASDPKGPEAGLARARPPVNFKRKDRMARQAKTWGARKLEAALRVLTDTDLQLRSSQPVPQMALMERALIRLAMMARR